MSRAGDSADSCTLGINVYTDMKAKSTIVCLTRVARHRRRGTVNQLVGLYHTSPAAFPLTVPGAFDSLPPRADAPWPLLPKASRTCIHVHLHVRAQDHESKHP